MYVYVINDGDCLSFQFVIDLVQFFLASFHIRIHVFLKCDSFHTNSINDIRNHKWNKKL